MPAGGRQQVAREPARLHRAEHGALITKRVIRQRAAHALGNLGDRDVAVNRAVHWHNSGEWQPLIPV